MASFNFKPHVARIVEQREREALRRYKIEQGPSVLVQALVHNIDSNNYVLELCFTKIDGDEGSLIIPRSLAASPQNVVLQLLDAGALLPNDRKAAADLVQRSLSQPAEISRAVTNRGGWHGSSFVTLGRTFGPHANSLSFVAPKIYDDQSIGMRRGTFEGWHEGLREACLSSSFLTFVLGIGYAGPLLDLLQEDEGAIFNFYGWSSSGKTFIARCLHSQAGRARKADLATYDINSRGAEELCFARNDWAVVIDEQGRTTGSPEQKREKVRKFAFMIPSGRGTIRSARVGGTNDLPNLSWRVLGVTSGEKPLENQVERRVAGEQLRHIDISVPHICHGGIFDLVEGEGEALGLETARLAERVESTIAANYGHARDRYLERLTRERSGVEADLRRQVDEFVATVGARTQAWERRLAQKFGIVAAGAMLAARWDIAPFSTEHARSCALAIYRKARSSIFSVEKEFIEMQIALREGYNQGKFPHLPRGATLPEEMRELAWGFRREEDGQDIVAVLPEAFNRLASSEPAAVAVLDKLIEKGTALRSPDGKRHRQIAAQGFPRTGRARWVCLLAERIC